MLSSQSAERGRIFLGGKRLGIQKNSTLTYRCVDSLLPALQTKRSFGCRSLSAHGRATSHGERDRNNNWSLGRGKKLLFEQRPELRRVRDN